MSGLNKLSVSFLPTSAAFFHTKLSREKGAHSCNVRDSLDYDEYGFNARTVENHPIPMQNRFVNKRIVVYYWYIWICLISHFYTVLMRFRILFIYSVSSPYGHQTQSAIASWILK